MRPDEKGVVVIAASDKHKKSAARRRCARLVAIVAASCLPLGLQAPAHGAPALEIFGPLSLTAALGGIDALWVAEGHEAPHLTLGSSHDLATRIEAGAPADVFLSADTRCMDAAEAAGLLLPGSRVTVTGNALVLVVPASRPHFVTLAPGVSLAAVLGGDGRLAVARIASTVPGAYAAESLRRLGVWNGVSGRLLETDRLQGTLDAVGDGEAAAGIVYRSDALEHPLVAIAGVFSDLVHPPIVYPGAVMKRSAQPAEGRAYLALLQSPGAQTIFRAAGFVPLFK